MDIDAPSPRAHRACRLATGIAVACLALLGLLLWPAIEEPPAALAASPGQAALPASSGSYTSYIPLIMRSISTILYPNDTYFHAEWGLEMVRAPHAWGLTCGCPSVMIAVIDSGVDLNHPDLAGQLRTDIGWDFVDGDATPDDVYGHGTHVAGIAAAATDNGRGVAGMGWNASILPLRVLNATGGGWSTDVAAAIRYAADRDAAVINLSLVGAVACPQHVQDAVDYAHARGVVLVAAAGNDGAGVENFPANCNHVMGVAALDRNGSVAAYSSYGSHVSVAAPGSEILSTLMGGGYGEKSGTSMATPLVAGLAALVRTVYPHYTPGQVTAAIMGNAVDIGASGWDPHSGCGRVDAYQALAVGARDGTGICVRGIHSAPAVPSGGASTAPFAPGEIVVAFESNAKDERTALQGAFEAAYAPELAVWRVRVPAGQEAAALARLNATPGVRYAELVYQVRAQD